MTNRCSLAAIAGALVLGAVPVVAQAPEPPSSGVPEIAVETELVRIDVVVTDDERRPIGGLTRDDFAVFEDEVRQEITRFEVFERGEDVGETEPPELLEEEPAAAPPTHRTRHVVLAIDDLHFDPGNLSRAKEAIATFVETEIGPEDEVAVVVTSGNLGLYQGFTGDLDLLRAAISRLAPRPRTTWTGVPNITEYQAELIERGDPEALDLAVEEIRQQGLMMMDPEGTARRKARAILQESTFIVRQALETLEGVVRGLAELPGRKVVVLVSDGFLMGLGTAYDQAFDLRRIVDAGTEAGVAVYSLDARGLVARAPVGDASSRLGPSLTRPGYRERLSRTAEDAARDGLHAVAEGTGGFLVRDTNDLGAGLARILRDTETYYLLAYEPTNSRRDGKFRRIEVRLPGRRGLEARTRRGYFAPDDREAKESRPDSEDAGRRAARELRGALASLYPRSDVPMRLAADFLSLGSAGPQMVVNANVDLNAVWFRSVGGQYLANLVIAGAVHDAVGQPVADLEPQLFSLSLSPGDYRQAQREGLMYNRALALSAGSYEVRLAVREDSEGRLGSAFVRLEIPDLDEGALKMSGPFLLRAGDLARPDEVADPGAEAPLQQVQASPRFRRSDSLYYMLQVLNATTDASGETDLTIRVHVFGGTELRASTPEEPLTLQQLDTIPQAYTGRIPLDSLPPGEFKLHLVVTDHLADTRVSRVIAFSVEP